MDFFTEPSDFMSLASTLLLLLLSTNRLHDLPSAHNCVDENEDEFVRAEESQESILAMESMSRAALHSFRLCNVFFFLDEDLGYWVKPRSTTWFSQFLLDQYDDHRWIKMFRMTKPAVFSLAKLLKPAVYKKDTKYRLAIPVVVRVACTLFKLTHGASLLICNEMFVVGRSTVSLVLREVVHAINNLLRSEISWPTGDKVREIEAGFKDLCGLPGVLGAIDGTHVSISKPKYGAADYFYFKSRGFTLNCHAVVDSSKRFLDLYLGMSGSTNDSRVLGRSSLYHRAIQNTLWDGRASFDGFSPSLLGDAGSPLMPWLMVPHPGHANQPLAEALFNKKMRRGRGVVENAFGMLKQPFRELLVKSDLDVTFLPDVITACAILHNVLLSQSHDDVERLLQVLRMEVLDGEVVDNKPAATQAVDHVRDEIGQPLGLEKRQQLGVFLALQRNVPM